MPIKDYLKDVVPTFHMCPIIDVVIHTIDVHMLQDGVIDYQTATHLKELMEMIRDVGGTNREAKIAMYDIFLTAVDEGAKPTKAQRTSIEKRCTDFKPKHKYITFHEAANYRRFQTISCVRSELNTIMAAYHARKKGIK